MNFIDFSDQEILLAVTEAAKLKQRANPKLFGGYGNGSSEKIPDYSPSYQIKVKDFEDIRIHAEPGVFPERLFAERSPNQEAREAEYIKKNYQQKTLNVFIDFCNTASRIFHDSSWSIEYKPDDDVFIKMNATFQQYVENNIGVWGSLENYMKEVVLSTKLRDAEGVIMVRPETIEMLPTEDGDVIDNSKLIEPEPYYFCVENVISEVYGDWILLEDTERSVVTFGAAKQEVGLIYWLLNRNNIWKIIQYGKASDLLFAVELFWQHNLNELFAYKLKGVPVYKNKQLIWQSPFLYATPYLNSAVLDEGNIMASKAKCVYPHVVQLGSLCQFRYTDSQGSTSACLEGQVLDSSLNTYIDCPSCKGLGVKSRMSPLGTILLKPKDMLNDGDSAFSGDPLKFIAPDTTTLDFLRGEINNAITNARKMMHLNDSVTDVKGSINLTATGQFMDMKSMYAFIKPISDQTFSLYELITNAIGKQRYGDKFQAPSFSYPVTFDFQTEADYIRQIKDLQEASAPPFMIQAVMLKYLRALFYNDSITSKAYDLLINTDRLIGLKSDEIAFDLSKGLVSSWEVILHESGFSFVNQLFIDSENTFFNQEFAVQKEQLIALAKAKALEAKPVSNPIDLVSGILNA